MANDLVSYSTLVQGLLGADTTRFPQATISAALRQTIDVYSRHVPILESGTITILANQQNYSLASLTGLILAYQVLNADGNPIAFNNYRQDGVTPYLTFSPAQPAGNLIVVRYTKVHTLKDLDSATVTTIRTDHTNIVVFGAVGYSLEIRMSSRLESDNLDPSTLSNYQYLSNKYLTKFYEKLASMIYEQGIKQVPGEDKRTWEDEYHNWPS